MPKTAFSGPYVDTGITTRGPYTQDVVPGVARKVDDHKATTVYDVAGTDIGHDSSGDAVDYPHAPNYAKPGRDPYAVGGMDDEVNPA